MKSKDSAKAEDYQLVKAPKDLSKKVRKLSAREAAKFDPVKAAEAAVENLSDRFNGWMGEEVDNLTSAWEDVRLSGFNEDNYGCCFRNAHDLKGQAETLGFPLVGRAAKNLALLLTAAKETQIYPMELLGQNVDAIRAMVNEEARDTTSRIGIALVERLEEVSAPLFERAFGEAFHEGNLDEHLTDQDNGRL
ncbi:Hpt domain-containing protein [Polycladidibacter hongkongensis]|uniref:Hpt domain-containing protein n=1 Tax=Polycladidibacter hongkongensis TaxID=1647556 RepID=UPI0009E67FD4|nr:Hpt domain-containing protein [Pseudovibrio hongkongensis]